MYLYGMVKDVQTLIKKLSPVMDENSEVFQELCKFFGEKAKIETNKNDLLNFLGCNRLYQVIRLQGESYKDCVYQLVDDFPEAMESLGMLRYYTSPAKFIKWEEIEKAEIALGQELTMAVYAWSPDAWTAFDNENPTDGSKYELVAIIATEEPE